MEEHTEYYNKNDILLVSVTGRIDTPASQRMRLVTTSTIRKPI